MQQPQFLIIVSGGIVTNVFSIGLTGTQPATYLLIDQDALEIQEVENADEDDETPTDQLVYSSVETGLKNRVFIQVVDGVVSSNADILELFKPEILR